MNADHEIYYLPDSLEDINEQFNKELTMQIAGKLPKGHIYKLGRPCRILLSTGFPDLPIELSSTRLEEKSKQENHLFDLCSLKDLVSALHNPMAVFSYGDKSKSQNVIVKLEYNSKQILTGIYFNQYHRNMIISDIRGLFPKDTSDWLNWITQGKALYLNKQKIQTLIDQQRINLADVAYLDLNLVESLIKTFENPL